MLKQKPESDSDPVRVDQTLAPVGQRADRERCAARPRASRAPMTAEAFLPMVPLFAGLTSDHLRLIIAAGRTKTFAKGETIFREGDASDGLYIVLAGKVRIYKQTDDGNE